MNPRGRNRSTKLRTAFTAAVLLALWLLSGCAAIREAADDRPARSRSGYSDSVPTAVTGGQSVGSELVQLDEVQDVVFNVNWAEELLPGLYRQKRSLHDRYGVAVNTDYSFLTQRASFSQGEDTGASSVFRIYGNWRAFGSSDGASGNFVFKFEHRDAIFGRQTPRDLGFATGSALSTANYKANGWGFTDFYWKAINTRKGNMLLIGHMDPGDWADQHYLLNAWTNLLNDAFYNNPTEAIPKRGLSLVGRYGIGERWYVAGGLHDANGRDNRFAFRQVFETGEVFSWGEFGFRSRGYSGFGETSHIHVWHQSELVEQGNTESYGVTISSSGDIIPGVKGVLRAGYSRGDAPQMRRFVGGAVSIPTRGSDRFQIGFGWGSPPDKELRDQLVLEVLYRLYLTQNLVLSPDIQVTFNPSFAEEQGNVTVVGLRVRLTF